METEIGLALRRARQARSLSLEQVSDALHIKPRYLRALEEGRWEDLPSPAQGRGFLRLYAAFLGLDLKTWLEERPQPPLEGGSLTAEEGLSSAGAAAEAAPSAAPAEAQEPASARPPTGEAPADDPAKPIFAELGRTLREQRERLGISLSEAERHTHVRRRNLEAMEAGRFDDLPSPVQARGMLQHYGRFLQLDTDGLLLRFADAIQVRYRARQQAAQPRRRPLRPPATLWPRVRLPERTLGLILLTVTALFVLWGGWQVFRARANTAPVPTPPSVLEVLFPTPSPTPTLAPFTPTPTPAALGLVPGEGQATAQPGDQPANQTSNAPIQVYIVVRQRAYVRVVVDGEERLAGRVMPGSTYFFGGDARIELTTGNAAALQVYFNQQNLGLLGRFGQAVTRIYTLNGVQTPTPSPTPTPTATPPVTPSPTPTLTPTPTAQAP